ncbi:siderophore-interacting protein [Gryllotalpicola ginsengisoli]|uniref:siderophore-interacting protein n=1 Tax=Gryllotalpicola ginsengisoli TaxID=444608 RepID=UPI0003B483E0|nr:siderophore-interacting protein [Gryllotalpicola ginsengisoli]
MPLTRERVRHELTRRTLTVARTDRLAPRFARITLTGPELHGFASPGPADHVKLFFPTGESRDFTPARFRAGDEERLPELDLDFVLHGDEGPASAWASRAREGDTLVVAGPRGSQLVPDGMTRLVVAADETAFPAAARWLSQAPEGVRTDAVLWPTDASNTAYFDEGTGAGASVTVVPAEGLDEAVRALEPFDETTFLFLAGEATALVPVRRHLRRELGLPPEQVQVQGYWKRGVAGLDHHAPVDPSDPD